MTDLAPLCTIKTWDIHDDHTVELRIQEGPGRTRILRVPTGDIRRVLLAIDHVEGAPTTDREMDEAHLGPQHTDHEPPEHAQPVDGHEEAA